MNIMRPSAHWIWWAALLIPGGILLLVPTIFRWLKRRYQYHSLF